MKIQKSLIVEAEGIDWDRVARLRIRATPLESSSLVNAGERIARLLTPNQLGCAGTDYAVVVAEPSGGIIDVAVPLDLMSPHLGVTQIINLLSIPSEYDLADSIVIEGIEVPQNALLQFNGPNLGVEGVSGIFGSTPIGVILKPRMLRDLDAACATVRELALEGVDFVVDDELTVETTDIPFCERVQRIVEELSRSSKWPPARNGFIANVTARPQLSIDLAEVARDLGADGLVTNPIVTGYGALEDLARLKLDLPIFATNMGAAFFARTPKSGSYAGIAEAVLAKLSRLAGADAVHVGIGESEWYAAAPGAGARSVLNVNLRSVKPVYRVIAGGLNAVRLLENWPFGREESVLFEGGSSVFSHPDGPAAGLRVLKIARAIAEEVSTRHTEGLSDAIELSKAMLLKESERNKEIAHSLEAIGWRPSSEIDRRRRANDAQRHNY